MRAALKSSCKTTRQRYRLVRYWLMGEERVVNVPVVTRFVREVIGCNCPDEVFRKIDVQRGSTAIQSCPAECELRIGGRLLIVVVSEPAEELSARLGRIIAEGRRFRDEEKFNRFRLVVLTGNPAGDRTKLLQAFEAVPAKDERTHLHVLGRGEVPNFFQ